MSTAVQFFLEALEKKITGAMDAILLAKLLFQEAEVGHVHGRYRYSKMKAVAFVLFAGGLIQLMHGSGTIGVTVFKMLSEVIGDFCKFDFDKYGFYIQANGSKTSLTYKKRPVGRHGAD